MTPKPLRVEMQSKKLVDLREIIIVHVEELVITFDNELAVIIE